MEEEAVREVVDRHLEAVRRGEPSAMAADYAEDAVLARPDRTFEGRHAIREYFATVPARLGSGVITFDDVRVDGDTSVVTWRIHGGPAAGTSGRDTLRVRDGKITDQVVVLDAVDF